MQEGASPELQRQVQDKLDPILQANPAVDKYFTIAGSGRAGSSGLFMVLFLKDAKDRKPIEEVASDLRQSLSDIPGIFPRLTHLRFCKSTSARAAASLDAIVIRS